MRMIDIFPNEITTLVGTMKDVQPSKLCPINLFITILSICKMVKLIPSKKILYRYMSWFEVYFSEGFFLFLLYWILSDPKTNFTEIKPNVTQINLKFTGVKSNFTEINLNLLELNRILLGLNWVLLRFKSDEKKCRKCYLLQATIFVQIGIIFLCLFHEN